MDGWSVFTFQSCNFSLHSSTWLCKMILFVKDHIFRWLMRRLKGYNLNWFIALLNQTAWKEHLLNWTTAKWISSPIFSWLYLEDILWVGCKKIRWSVILLQIAFDIFKRMSWTMKWCPITPQFVQTLGKKTDIWFMHAISGPSCLHHFGDWMQD